ncbi:MAG: haloacid dehalogenase-like hydrolase [Cyanobacteria bacterium SZAS TMP-1]|nr:haloacid dehalogenase-like hydrolase [Cyanobacteria bacterium SZAS TMP-1]
MKNYLSLALALGLVLSMQTRGALADSTVTSGQSPVAVESYKSGVHKGDPLRSWADGKAKERIVNFVKDVVDPKSKNFVPLEDRYATFDNDGTILCEKPAFFEVIYTRDRARAVQEKHPEWASDPQVQKFLKSSDDDLLDVHTSESMKIMAQAAGYSSLESLREPAMQWLDSAKHQRFKQLYKKLHYRPMLELIDYLRANGFKVYLCSGGQADFMRCYASSEYGIDSSQVIGSSLELEYSEQSGKSEIVAQPKLQVFNINGNKPVTISQHIGKRPVIACGNSDGDTQMLTYAGDRNGPSLSILIQHDDAAREYSYNRGAEKVLPIAAQKGWLVVSMKDDFLKVFDF